MRFTAANAREMALRSVAARKAAEAERKAKAAATPLRTGPPAVTSLEEERLARAREYDLLLHKLKTQLGGERDPMKQDRLASAIARLEEVYQVYANIPKPGRRKLPQERPQQKGWAVGLPPEPQIHAVPIQAG